MELQLVRRLNDQTPSPTSPEPLQLGLKHDLVTSTGLARIAALAAHDNDRFFSTFASGTGTQQERKADSKLGIENARVSLIDSGYSVGAGTSMKFAGFFPNTIDSDTITEGAVFDADIGGTMLFRTVYNVTLDHTQFQTTYSLTQTIIFNAITDEGLA